MPGTYIRCDSCGKTINGEDYAEFGIPSRCWPMMSEIAMRNGWTGDLNRESTNDKCPECSNKAARHE